MSPDILALSNPARESIEAAEKLFQEKFYRFSVSRAYYAMFYVAEALHVSEGRSYARHRAVISAFARHFVKSGRFDARFHKYLSSAFQVRMAADYDPTKRVPRKEAQIALRRAQEFLDVARAFLQTGR